MAVHTSWARGVSRYLRRAGPFLRSRDCFQPEGTSLKNCKGQDLEVSVKVGELGVTSLSF